MGTLFNNNFFTHIENVQRCFTKHITGMNNLEYEQRLMALKLPSLDYRRAYLQLYMVTMIMRLFVPCSSCIHVSAGTRGHPFKLHKKTVLTNPYAHFFLLRQNFINNWNSLPSNIILAGTLNSLKSCPYKH